MARKKVKPEKSVVVGMELRINRRDVTVHVRRRWPGDRFEWTMHRVTPESIRRLARLAEKFANEEGS